MVDAQASTRATRFGRALVGSPQRVRYGRTSIASIFAAHAAARPSAESSKRRQFSGGRPNFSAAIRETFGAGLGTMASVIVTTAEKASSSPMDRSVARTTGRSALEATARGICPANCFTIRAVASIGRALPCFRSAGSFYHAEFGGIEPESDLAGFGVPDRGGVLDLEQRPEGVPVLRGRDTNRGDRAPYARRSLRAPSRASAISTNPRPAGREVIQRGLEGRSRRTGAILATPKDMPT